MTKYALRWLRVYPRYRWTRYDILVRRGGIATIVFFGFVFFLSFFETCIGSEGEKQCGSKAWAFFKSPPNEIGDTLAGIAGALAFLWIIVTVMLQSKELGAQRQELRLARKESAKMAHALQAQADIFKDEKRYRDEQEAKELFSELLSAFKMSLVEANLVWVGPTDTYGHREEIRFLHYSMATYQQHSDEEFFASLLNELTTKQPSLVLAVSGNTVPKQNNWTKALASARLLRRTLEVFESLSAAEKVKVQRLRLAKIEEELGSLLKLEVWTANS